MDSRTELGPTRVRRYMAPPRASIDAQVWRRAPLCAWRDEFTWLDADVFPAIDELDALLPKDSPWRFIEQTSALLDDGLHYEQRIARGAIPTRADNWHDLFNALIWLRYPQVKAALNGRQIAEIAVVGTKQRSRAQCALTHFDEAGVIVLLRDPGLLALWDAHDWHALFWRERGAWSDGRIGVEVFGHALLEHALSPQQLLVGKCIAVLDSSSALTRKAAVRRVAAAIASGEALNDPQDLRPLPLSGIPGWHADCGEEDFYQRGACFRPLRAGRRYPAPLFAPA